METHHDHDNFDIVPVAKQQQVDRRILLKTGVALLTSVGLAGCRDQNVAKDIQDQATELSLLLEGSGLAVREHVDNLYNHPAHIYYIGTHETCARIVKQADERFFVYWRRGVHSDPSTTFDPLDHEDSDHFDTAEDAVAFIKKKFGSGEPIPSEETVPAEE